MPETASAAYDPGTTYALHATASVAGALGLITEYRSLQASNVGHAPASSPTWWAKVGDTYQVYASGSTYALGERVIDPVNHMVYESYLAGNIGQPLTDTTKWQKIGATNKFAMFDMLSSAATVAPGSLTWVLTPGQRVNSLGLLGMIANTVIVSASSGGNVVYTATADLNTRYVFNHTDYAFKPFSTKPSIVRFDIPPHSDIVITITIAATEGDVSIKWCGIDLSEYIGDVLYNPTPGGKNYSTVERNSIDGGINRMIPRPRIPTVPLTLAVDKSRVNAVDDLLVKLDGRTAIWAGLHDDSDGYFDLLLVCGFCSDFSWDLDAPTSALLKLTLESI
ncbi:MAG: hypothetical protein ACXWFA_18210 [Methylobacter sp.]